MSVVLFESQMGVGLTSAAADRARSERIMDHAGLMEPGPRRWDSDMERTVYSMDAARESISTLLEYRDVISHSAKVWRKFRRRRQFGR